MTSTLRRLMGQGEHARMHACSTNNSIQRSQRASTLCEDTRASTRVPLGFLASLTVLAFPGFHVVLAFLLFLAFLAFLALLAFLHGFLAPGCLAFLASMASLTVLAFLAVYAVFPRPWRLKVAHSIRHNIVHESHPS